MSAEEFAGIGLAPGVVRGVRSFKFDKLGRLTGIHYSQVWKPGDNSAECRAQAVAQIVTNIASYTDVIRRAQQLTQAIYAPSPSSHFNYTTTTTTGKPVKQEEPKRSALDTHSMADCAHGFYAYYDGSDDYRADATISGVVEGWGETLIGTRGFRCMKARIVALHLSDDVSFRTRNLIGRNYPEVPVFDTFDRMVSEYRPDSAGAGISPDTDPDFWTRSA